MSEVAVDRAPARERQELREWMRSAYYLGQREVRLALRTPAYLLPNLIMPAVFFFILVGSLSRFGDAFGFDYKAFQLPVGIIFAVTGGSAGLNLVTDIESGYFNKLLLTPSSRLAILLGAMGADFMRIVLQGLVIVLIGMSVGTQIETGVAGAMGMVGIASLWGFAYSAIGFAVALRSGNSQVVGSMWAFQMPFMFLTTSFAPKEALADWLATASRFNPMTYVLEGLRALSMPGGTTGEVLLAIAIAIGFGALTLTFAMRALKSRVH